MHTGGMRCLCGNRGNRGNLLPIRTNAQIFNTHASGRALFPAVFATSTCNFTLNVNQ